MPASRHRFNKPRLTQAFPTRKNQAVIHLDTGVKHTRDSLHCYQPSRALRIHVLSTRQPRLNTGHTVPLKTFQVLLHRVERVVLGHHVNLVIDQLLRRPAHVVSLLDMRANLRTVSISELIILTRGDLTPREITKRHSSKVHLVVRQPAQHRVMLPKQLPVVRIIQGLTRLGMNAQLRHPIRVIG